MAERQPDNSITDSMRELFVVNPKRLLGKPGLNASRILQEVTAVLQRADADLALAAPSSHNNAFLTVVSKTSGGADVFWRGR
jgi:hypothetical protein